MSDEFDRAVVLSCIAALTIGALREMFVFEKRSGEKTANDTRVAVGTEVSAKALTALAHEHDAAPCSTVQAWYAELHQKVNCK